MQAENGRVAVEKLLAREEVECCVGYEVVFMDIDMPVMDGIEVRRLLRWLAWLTWCACFFYRLHSGSNSSFWRSV